MKSPTIAAAALIVIRPSATLVVAGGHAVLIIAGVLTLYVGFGLGASAAENWARHLGGLALPPVT
jgi:hypothetical protein